MVKKFFKSVAIILTLVMMFGLIAACRQNEPASTDTGSTDSGTGTDTGTDAGTGSDPVASGFDIESASEITITVLGSLEANPRAPTEDILLPIWREKTKVIPDIVEYDEGAIGWAQFFQMHHLGGTMPMVLTGGGIGGHSEAQMALREFEILREITLEEIYEYLPRTVARLESLGIDIELWYESNIDPILGYLTHIPGFPNLAATNLRNEPEVKIHNSYEGYAWWVRDDILKQVFPDVLTEAELKDLYISQGGTLTFDQARIPIENFDELTEFLRAVKDLNITVDGQPIVPAQIQLNDNITSLMWSAFSLMDLFWHTLADRTYNFADRTYHYFAATQTWKDYISFMNGAFNEGLVHPETFIMMDDQRNAMIANGQFAMWQMWHGVDAARESGIARGEDYGFRLMHLFLPDDLVNPYQDASMRVVDLSGRGQGYGISYNAPEEWVPQILNWIDWNQSLEAAELRAWGLPEMSTGTGRDRRFTEEYKDLELWWLTGQSGPEYRDGIYYGISRDGPFTRSTVETNTQWLAGGWDYFPNPIQAYPRDLSDPASIDINSVVSEVVREHYYSMFNFFIEGPLSDDVIEARAEFELHNSTAFAEIKMDYSFDSPGGQAAIVATIIGPVNDFEANYQLYYDRFIDVPRFKDVMSEEMRLYFAWMELYMNHLVPMN